jgi:ABC-2 type transport system permease protein
MTRLVHSELLKLRTTRAVWGFLVATAGIVALGVAGELSSGPVNGDEGQEALVRVVEPTGSVVPVFALLLGVLAFTVELRHGTMTQTFLVTPARERVLAAKAIAYALVGVVLACVAVGLALAIAVPWLSRDGNVSLADDALGAIVAGVVGACALWSVLGVALGAVLRNQVFAIVGVLVWVLILEAIVGALAPDAARYLPGAASRAMSARPVLEFDGGEQLTRTAASLLTAAYAAGLAVLAGVEVRRRDVS